MLHLMQPGLWAEWIFVWSKLRQADKMQRWWGSFIYRYIQKAAQSFCVLMPEHKHGQRAYPHAGILFYWFQFSLCPCLYICLCELAANSRCSNYSCGELARHLHHFQLNSLLCGQNKLRDCPGPRQWTFNWAFFTKDITFPDTTLCCLVQAELLWKELSLWVSGTVQQCEGRWVLRLLIFFAGLDEYSSRFLLIIKTHHIHLTDGFSVSSACNVSETRA